MRAMDSTGLKPPWLRPLPDRFAEYRDRYGTQLNRLIRDIDVGTGSTRFTTVINAGGGGDGAGPVDTAIRFIENHPSDDLMLVSGFVMDDDVAHPHTWVATSDRKTAYETSRSDWQFKPHYGYIMTVPSYRSFDRGRNEWVYNHRPDAQAFGLYPRVDLRTHVRMRTTSGSRFVTNMCVDDQ